MTPMRALRANPHFAHLFARVHPLCWWVLGWSLNRLLDWYETSGYEEILYETSPWGFIRIAYFGDRTPGPSAYRPYVPERLRWDDPVWSTNVPVRQLTPAAPSVFPRAAGGGGSALRALTEGACARLPGYRPAPV